MFGLFMPRPDSGRKDMKAGKIVLTVRSGQSLPCFLLLLSCHLYHCLSLL
jgi:hypothetical protein